MGETVTEIPAAVPVGIEFASSNSKVVKVGPAAGKLTAKKKSVRTITVKK